VVDPLTAPLAQVMAANVPAEMAQLNATPASPVPPPVPPPAPAPTVAVVPPPEWLAEPDPQEQTPAPSVAADEAAAAWTPPPAAPVPSGHTWDAESVPDAWVAESAAAARTDSPPAGSVDPETSVEAMLAMLAAEQHHMDTKQAPWTRYFEDKSTRVMVMVGGSLALAFSLFTFMAIVGWIF
jgi:hypothetical protein